MKNELKPLSRAEMKEIKGGVTQYLLWHCQDVAGGPYISVGCSTADPAGRPNCPEYSCYTDNVKCPSPTGCS